MRARWLLSGLLFGVGCERADERTVRFEAAVPHINAPGSPRVSEAHPIDNGNGTKADNPGKVSDRDECGPDDTTDNDDCGSALQAPTPDIYRALVKATGEQRGTAALAVLRHRSGHASAVVQRAILAVTAEPFCSQLRPLTCTLTDPTMDDETRGAAALALGLIARDFPCTFPAGACPRPHDPIPQWSQKALNDCVRFSPAMVARSCAEALGYVSTADRVTLTAVRDDASKDSLLRLFAGRALTRLTQTQQVTVGSLDALMVDAKRASSQ
jgi:hypothetical protein